MRTHFALQAVMVSVLMMTFPSVLDCSSVWDPLGPPVLCKHVACFMSSQGGSWGLRVKFLIYSSGMCDLEDVTSLISILPC